MKKYLYYVAVVLSLYTVKRLCGGGQQYQQYTHVEKIDPLKDYITADSILQHKDLEQAYATTNEKQVMLDILDKKNLQKSPSRAVVLDTVHVIILTNK